MRSRLIGLRLLVLVMLASLVCGVASADAQSVLPGKTVGDWLDIASNVIAAAAIVAAALPVPTKVTGAIAAARKFIDLLAFNFGNAKNKR